MTNLHIRHATPADIDTVLAFWREAAEGTSISDDRDGVARLVDRDPEALLLAERDGVLSGTVIAGFDGWRCHLYRLAVLPEHRRKGLAAQLVATAVVRARALGATRLDAMIVNSNEAAIGFWATVGFTLDTDDSRWCRTL